MAQSMNSSSMKLGARPGHRDGREITCALTLGAGAVKIGGILAIFSARGDLGQNVAFTSPELNLAIATNQRTAFSSSFSLTSFIILEIVLRSTLNNSAISA
jgi:hypothetical protein